MEVDIVTSNSKGRGAERTYLLDPGSRRHAAWSRYSSPPGDVRAHLD
jgi:hypothetical protein